MTGATVVVPTVNGATRLARLLESLGAGDDFGVIVVDNGSSDGTAELVRRRFPAVDLVERPRNEGFARAVNLGAARAEGDALVLVNDDCVCAPGFVAALARALDRRRGAVAAAGVLAEARDPNLIDTAGMEIDATLLVFDYLNGAPLSVLDGTVADPIGPCAAAAAYDREVFLEAGGFDEALFAYWEDVDLTLRLLEAGGRCVLAPDARGTHEHSATLRSGSARKNYLVGYGRGYLLRKYGVLSPRRLPGILVRDGPILVGQALVDRNLAGARGRVAGYRAAAGAGRRPYPGAFVVGRGPRALTTLRRRLARRLRLARGTT